MFQANLNHLDKLRNWHIMVLSQIKGIVYNLTIIITFYHYDPQFFRPTLPKRNHYAVPSILLGLQAKLS
jgi:hypothetical protein